MVASPRYDALLLVSFGGPEKDDDVMPFLENVTRGRNVPRERLVEVAEHYHRFGGKSPINDQCRELKAAIERELSEHGPRLPVYWGNRNWHPLLPDTLRQMREDGVTRSLAFMTSAYSSYSGCRQYRENLKAAQEAVGEDAPQVDKLRVFYNHPHFVEASADAVRDALKQIPDERRSAAELVFTAHSIPCSMAETSAYEKQLRETCRLVTQSLGVGEYRLVFQSRSGAPNQPWLGPDILDYLRTLPERLVTDVVVAPIGFISDHMEVLYDLDTEAKGLATELNLNLVRAATAGTHPMFVRMVRELVEERMNPNVQKLSVGQFGPNHDVCPVTCCAPPARPEYRQRG
jgi:protoporphyrin/coproporphyrin ferrochelatase